VTLVLARARQLGTWFWLGLVTIVGVGVVVVGRIWFRSKQDRALWLGLDDVMRVINQDVAIANARAAAEIAVARSKEHDARTDLAFAVNLQNEADRLRALVALRERLER
jgi:hypothetical protein